MLGAGCFLPLLGIEAAPTEPGDQVSAKTVRLEKITILRSGENHVHHNDDPWAYLLLGALGILIKLQTRPTSPLVILLKQYRYIVKELRVLL